MAYFKFTENILANNEIEIYVGGLHNRDFTFIDDVVRGLVTILEKPPSGALSKTENTADFRRHPHRLYNIELHGNPVGLMEMIEILEAKLGVLLGKNS